MARLNLRLDSVGDGCRVRRAASGKGMLAVLALVCAALQPVDGRPLARPAVGSRARRRRAPDPLALSCLRRFLVAVLRILGVRSSPSSPGSASSTGACGAGISLRRSFVAYLLWEFPTPCPAGRQASVGRRASKLASNQKTTGGRRDAGRSPRAAPPTPLLGQEGTTP
jgi:hypothetical protein